MAQIRGIKIEVPQQKHKKDPLNLKSMDTEKSIISSERDSDDIAPGQSIGGNSQIDTIEYKKPTDLVIEILDFMKTKY